MASVVTVRDTDKGWEAFKDNIAEMHGMATAVGVLGNTDARSEGSSNATIYAANEFGVPSKGIPERSSLRSTIDTRQREYTALGAHLADRVGRGELTARQAHEILGLRIVADIKRAIQQGVPPPNKPATVKAKGSSKTLIDSGQMVNSITNEVRTV